MEWLPIWAVYGLTVVFTLAAIELGHWLGKLWQRRNPDEKEGSMGALAGATLGLLAFLLAFTTGMAVSRFDTRRQLVVSEANAIGTTNLRAGYLDEPHRQEVRDLLREYVDVRLSATDIQQLDEIVARSEEIQTSLWSHAETLARANPTSPTMALFIEALNEMIDLHTVRYIAVQNAQLPAGFWFAIYAVTFLTMLLVGIQASFAPRQNFLALLLLALVFGAVIVLIADLSSSREGVLNVSQQAMLDLQRQLHAAAP
jgi:hypothetical protein